MANGTNTTLNYSGMLNVDGSAQTATGGAPVGTGNGGSATLNASGNIFKPLGSSFLFTGTSIGANGAGGGNGGNATTTVSGNILNASTTLTSIELDSIAEAGTGTKYGNATATMSGNIINYTNGTATNVVLKDQAFVNGSTNVNNLIDSTANNGNSAFGTKTATVSGNVVTGNINNFTIDADAYLSNATASISGNVFNAKAGSGVGKTVTLEAMGQTISITGNVLNLGKQNVTVELDQLGPTYKSTFAGNIFNGSGTNILTLDETQQPASPSLDTASFNVGTHILTFDGQSNIINNFAGVAFAGDTNATFVGTSGNDTLNGSSSTTTGTLIFQGNGGMDAITGGPNALNVVDFAGGDWQYNITPNANQPFIDPTTVATVPGNIIAPNAVIPASNDTLHDIQRLKFLSPVAVSDVNDDGFGDQVIYNTTTGGLQVDLPSGPVVAGQPTTLTTVPETGTTAGYNAIGTGQFTPDTNRDASLLLQSSTTGALEIASGLASGTPTITPLTSSLVGFNDSTTFTGWTAITAGDFNGDASSDILLQQGSGGPVEIAFLKTSVTDPVGKVDAISAVTAPSGTGWNAISAGDFNGDGNSDILWQNSTTGAIDVSLMNGASGTPTSVGTADAGFTAIGTGDFNGDGKSDILFYNSTTHQADIWLMNGTTKVADSGPINAPTTPAVTYTLTGAEDVNKDGFSDLVWTGSPGYLVATEMTGTSNTVSVLNQNITLGAMPSGFHLVASTGGG